MTDYYFSYQDHTTSLFPFSKQDIQQCPATHIYLNPLYEAATNSPYYRVQTRQLQLQHNYYNYYNYNYNYTTKNYNYNYKQLGT